MLTNNTLRVAIASWEIGRDKDKSGLGAKVGGLGVVVEELPQELMKAASKLGIDLEIEILSPCFAFYDKSNLKNSNLPFSVTINNHSFDFEVYEHTFSDEQKCIYFWDDWQLNGTVKDPATGKIFIYPGNSQKALYLYASVCQAMAGYIKQKGFNTIHLHDYHVGLIPFYLGDEYLREASVHLTIHNATYQGVTPLISGGYESLNRINLDGEKLFHKYFDFFDYLNLMKACMLKVHETGGKITTVSGNLEGSWGYAAELKESRKEVWNKARKQKGNNEPREIFLPNNYLDIFEKLPIIGITNGLGENNRPEKIEVTRKHKFDAENIDAKKELKSELLDTIKKLSRDFDKTGDPILLTVVGRMVEQKNLGLVADIIPRTLKYDPRTRFVILASAPDDDEVGKNDEKKTDEVAFRYPGRVYFDKTYNSSLAKLILSGGDFCLIPSKFEPCGLVDYEAALLGNIPICRSTGGLVKIEHCGYLYEWLDVGDRDGEAEAFFQAIKKAIDTYRADFKRHQRMISEAMKTKTSWDESARTYLEMYRYGLLTKEWYAERRKLIANYIQSLESEDVALFTKFFAPGQQEYGDRFDWELKEALTADMP